jgi:arsenate reductase
MKKMYHLSSCSTCAKIIKSTEAEARGVTLHDIKAQPISPDEIDGMRALAGSYEALFSRRAMKYKSMGLAEKQLTEADYRTLILDEYTFLKRPVTIVGTSIFVGNAASTTAALAEALK